MAGMRDPNWESEILRYLPEDVQGKRILCAAEDKGWYRVDNKQLQAPAKGTSYMKSKDSSDKDGDLPEIPWDSLVRGELQDGWLTVKLEALDKFELSCKAVKIPLFIADVSVGHSGRQKIVHYDGSKLLQWGAVSTMFCKGTIFSIDIAFWVVMAQYVGYCIFGCFILSVLRVTGQFELEEFPGVKECTDIQRAALELNSEKVVCPEIRFVAEFDKISSTIQPLTMFIFGLFTSLSINRWWALRVDSLGCIMDAIVYITALLSSYLVRHEHLSDEEVKHTEQDIIKCMKLGIASLQAITQKSRGEVNMKELVDVELITSEEAALLEHCPSSTQVLWSWLGSLGDEVMVRLKVPPPNHNPFWSEVQGASNAITRMEAYHDSQLPYPYVHMIVMLVNINNISIAFLDGMHLSQAYLRGAHFEICLLVVHLLLVPTMYQALLMICFLIEDPLGDDVTDFPIIAFQSRTYNESKRVVKSMKGFWELRRKAGLLDEPKPATPAPAAPVTLTAELEKRVQEEVVKRLEPEIAKQKIAVQKRMEELLKRADEITTRTIGTRQVNLEMNDNPEMT